MKIYVISHEIGGPWQYEISPIHSILFHGEILNIKESLWRGYEDHKIRMSLRKNVYSMPEVFSPMIGSLVLLDSICSCLASIPNIRFLPVEFETLYFLPYAANDHSITRRFLTPEKWESYTRKIKHNPALQKAIGTYSEMITHRYHTFIDEFRDSRMESISVDFGPATIDDCEMQVSVDMFEKYPIFVHGYLFCSQKPFEILKDHLDWTYFMYNEIELQD